MRKLRKSVRIAGGLLLASAGIGTTLFFHHYDLNLTLHGDATYRQQVGESFQDPGADAYMESNLFPFLNKI